MWVTLILKAVQKKNLLSFTHSNHALIVLLCKSTSATSSTKKGQFGKNPTVDTSFLPDRDREELDRKEREELRQRWLKMQEAIKQEDIEITYSYWDGTGHRKEVTVSISPVYLHECILISLTNPSKFNLKC